MAICGDLHHKLSFASKKIIVHFITLDHHHQNACLCLSLKLHDSLITIDDCTLRLGDKSLIDSGVSTDGGDLNLSVTTWEGVDDASQWPVGGDQGVLLDHDNIVRLNVSGRCLPLRDLLQLLQIFMRPSSPEVLHLGLA